MPGALTRTWFLPTSPRSPSKVRDELALLARFDGCEWWERDAAGNLVNQMRFAELLENSDFYEGTVSEGNEAFAARDRLRAPQMLGLVRVAPDGIEGRWGW